MIKIRHSFCSFITGHHYYKKIFTSFSLYTATSARSSMIMERTQLYQARKEMWFHKEVFDIPKLHHVGSGLFHTKKSC